MKLKVIVTQKLIDGFKPDKVYKNPLELAIMLALSDKLKPQKYQGEKLNTIFQDFIELGKYYPVEFIYDFDTND